tara:strand:+ start:177 stop:470 length:294 start_codon:yes stop_codon:yes gene_type:complete
MLGLAYDELYSLTPRSFNNRLLGFSEHQEQINQNNWEQTRLIIHACLSPHSKKRLKPKDILPLPWDSKNSPKKIIASPEQIKADVERHKKILKKMQK